MSLRILFADDSVTAQNMGKKILTDAGYEVVAVSNGAAAVKKIAEQKPDIIILDVYMPGYSGLEVCEKVRASVLTLNTPVLLTVGKMEPYRPEEANRVKADGVIVKPFEASDLLAIVKKFEERISLASGPPRVEQDLAERYGESAVAAPSMENPEPVVKNTNQPTVEVPDHMATTSAFSDLLGADPSDSGAFNASGPPSAHEPAPRASVPVPDYDLPFSWRDAADSEAYASTAATPAVPVVKEVKEAIAEPSPAPLPARLLHIPVYREPEPEKPAKAPEIVATAAPPTGDVDIPREPALQETAAETTRNTVAESTEPGLMPTMQQDVTQQDPAPVPAADTDVSEPAPAESQYASAYTQDAPANIAPETPVVKSLPPKSRRPHWSMRPPWPRPMLKANRRQRKPLPRTLSTVAFRFPLSRRRLRLNTTRRSALRTQLRHRKLYRPCRNLRSALLGPPQFRKRRIPSRRRSLWRKR